MCCTYTFVIIVFSHSWYLDMYINPSQYISAVFIALASTMLILLLIVAILKHFEKVLFFFREQSNPSIMINRWCLCEVEERDPPTKEITIITFPLFELL